MKRINHDDLLDLTLKYLVERNIPISDALIIADYFITAELYGVSSHGLEVLPSHINRMNNGGYNINPQIKVVKETNTFALVDGDNSFGPLCGKYCADLLIKHCSDEGVYMINSFNNNTYGAAFYYPLLMARKGLIGITFSNSPAQMAPTGGKDKMLGTNPFSVVIPNGDNPIIIDMATSIVSKSRFKQYSSSGLPLEEGWALDKDGNPTTDPEEGILGLILPMAGSKGYGIALIIDIIAGLLSGASYLNDVKRFYSEEKKCMDVGFSFIGINPIHFYGEGFADSISDYVSRLRSSSLGAGQSKIILPGDKRLDCYKINIKEGIEVTDDLYHLLTESHG